MKSATDYFNWIGNYNYARRCKMDPNLCSTMVGGFNKVTGEPFLGYVDAVGTKIISSQPAEVLGLGRHYCGRLLEEANANDPGNLTEAQAREVVEKCMRVMFYRDKSAIDNIQITTVTANGVTEHEPYRIESEWNLDWYRTQTNEKFRPMRVRI